MFAYIPTLQDIQLKIIKIVAQHETTGDKAISPDKLTQIVSEMLPITPDLAIQHLDHLFLHGFICNFSRQDTWGIKVSYGATGCMSIATITETPVILTPAGRGFVQNHDLIIQVLESLITQMPLSSSEKASVVKKISTACADKGLDFLAKLCTEGLIKFISP